MIYYMLLNVLCVVDVGVIWPSVINIKRWKFGKMFVTLLKNWTQWGRAILLYHINRKNFLSIGAKFDQYNNAMSVSQNLQATEIIRNYISMHSNINEQVLGLINNMLRIIQLNYKLDIVFWKELIHPISISVIIVFHNITALIKIWLIKRYNKFSGRAIQVNDYLIY